MNERIKKQLDFIVEVDKIKTILRRNLTIVDKRRENDAEHSWHIALMAPLLMEYIEEEVDILKVMKMVIIHDLVEIDAGDTYAYDVVGYSDKREREVAAANRIFNILPEDQAKEITKLWYEFEEEETMEARYACCVDRLQPFILNYYSDGLSWMEHKVTKTQVMGRMKIIKETSNGLWEMFMYLLESAIEKGYIKEE